MADRFPSDLTDKMLLRVPDGLRARIAALAKANGRSSNAEAVKALEEWADQAEHAQQSAHEVANDLPVPQGPVHTVYIDIEAGVGVSMEEIIAQSDIVQEAVGLPAADYRVRVSTPALAARDTRSAQVADMVRRSREAFTEWRAKRKRKAG